MSDSTALIREDNVPVTLRQRVQSGFRDSSPNSRQIGLLAGIALAVALGIWIFTWSQQPGYVPLYAGLTAKDGGEVVEALRAAEIPYRVDPASGAITVPEARVNEVRMKLATQGLPQGDSHNGIEKIEGDQGFGVSQFMENARYQHALETELARTIATLRPVRSARVHLGLPKPSAFSRGRQPASASVVLDLFPGRALEQNQIAAIAHVVSSSIPDMAPERVTVVDQTGHLLTNADPDSEEAQSARQFAEVRQIESAYVERIRRLLEPLIGAGRISAQVNVDMDFSVVEEARETYNNDPAKLRSEQTSEQVAAGTQPAGVPGATSNTPQAAAPSQASAANSTSSRSATRNYELDRTLTHTRQSPHRVKRITAAVLIDNIPQVGKKGVVTYRALTAAEQTRLESLVREAIGFSSARGDSTSVVNAPFMHAPESATSGSLPLWETLEQAPPLAKDALRLVVGLLVLLALIFGVLRPVLRQLVAAKPAAPPLPSGDPFAVLNGPALTDNTEGAALRAMNASPAEAYEDAFRRARAAVGEDPKRVAQVVKNWVNNNG
jgi:flagellar M-ring protein FliF